MLLWALVGFYLWALLLWMGIDQNLGPAHAAYFLTYESVKHLMGGNQAGKQHHIASGMPQIIPQPGRMY